jgi:hypothetical protein
MSDKTDACLANLSPSDQKHLLLQILGRSKNACAWILKNQKFISWHNSNASSLLWVTAKAGCGKTTTAAHIYRIVSSIQPSEAFIPPGNKSQPILLHFFFQKSNQQAENTASAALRTFAAQLIHQEPQLLPILLRRHGILSAKGTYEWSWENLLSLISEMLEQPLTRSQIYVIIDAVDECEVKSQKLVLDWIKELVEDNAIAANSKTSGPMLKILVTSRPDGDIIDQLAECPTLNITKEDTSNDIQSLINNWIETFARHRHLNSSIIRNITQFLEQNAYGMFLWVILIMEELEKRDERLTDEVVMSKLSRIPLDLDNTYTAILQNLSSTRKADTWRILRWVLFGTRNFTMAELNIALCLEIGVSTWHGFAWDVRFLCGSLIRINGPQEEIHLIHRTARDFLQNFTQKATTMEVAGLNLEPHAANEQLAMICVRYLLQDDLYQDLNDSVSSSESHMIYTERMDAFIGKYQFVRYVIESWAFHIRAVGTPSAELLRLITLLLLSITRRNGIMRLTNFICNHGSYSSPVCKTTLHLAAYFDFTWLVESCLKDGTPVDIMSDTDDTPLIWASEMGSTECVEKLLVAGANPNSFEYDGWSALHWAARNGHADVALMLLENGAQLDPLDEDDCTPLDWASDREHWNVVEVLESWSNANNLATQGSHQEQRRRTSNQG